MSCQPEMTIVSNIELDKLKTKVHSSIRTALFSEPMAIHTDTNIVFNTLFVA